MWHEGQEYEIHTQYRLLPLKLLLILLQLRTKRIKVSDHLQLAFNLKSGVPQDSVLGPSLYSLSTNGTPESSLTYSP